MQQPELGGSRYLRPRPPSSLANSTDEQFAPNEQTAEVAPACSAEQDIVQTHYSPRGVVLLYFQGDSSVEVDKHFNRTFSELYCLPLVRKNVLMDHICKVHLLSNSVQYCMHIFAIQFYSCLLERQLHKNIIHFQLSIKVYFELCLSFSSQNCLYSTSQNFL